MSDFDNEMQKSTQRESQDRRDQELYGGLIRLHILHHASKEPVFGLWFIEELARHGYKLSPGLSIRCCTALNGKDTYDHANERSGKDSGRRMYRATPLGRKVLVAAREKVSELFGELLEDE